MEKQVHPDLDLWARFGNKLIGQTEDGSLKWSVRYFDLILVGVCRVRDYNVWIYSQDRKLIVMLVDNKGLRRRIPIASELISKLANAINAQLDPQAQTQLEQFAREFLGEA